VLFVADFCSLLLCELEYQYGMKHSFALVGFWVISVTLNGIRLNAMVIEAEEKSIWDDNSVGFIVIELVCPSVHLRWKASISYFCFC
jgi:hypothetical protein